MSNSSTGISNKHGSASELTAKSQLQRQSEFLLRPHSSLLLLRNSSTNGTSTGIYPLRTPLEVHTDDVDDHSCHLFDSDKEVRCEQTVSSKNDDDCDDVCVAQLVDSLFFMDYFGN